MCALPINCYRMTALEQHWFTGTCHSVSACNTMVNALSTNQNEVYMTLRSMPVALTLWGWDKMAVIFQTTFFNPNFFNPCCSLVPNRQQATIGMDDDHVVLHVSGGFNTLRPRQNDRHFPDNIFQCIFLILIEISLKFVPKGSNQRYSSIGSDNGLASTRQQASIWTNDVYSLLDAYMHHSDSASMS